MQETLKPLLPPTLKKGDTIGLAPLAGPFQDGPYQKGLTILRDLGFTVKTLQTSTPQAYLAGSDAERLAIFHELWKDPEVAGILGIRGGYGTMRLLDNIDFDLIRTHPKPLIGFSDISGFNNVITERTGLITFHGPNLTTLDQCDKESLACFFHTLTSMAPFAAKNSIEVLRSGHARGVLAGGNLTTLNHLLGTPFELNFDGKILILEDINEPPYALDRLFYQLFLAGKLSKLQGLILGDFSHCGETEDLWKMVLDLLKDTPFPIWGNFPVGHGEQNILWPIGGTAEMDSGTGLLSYPEQVMVK
ncbi:MAG: LD-carboxypeptidase [Desulfobulbaceae bacterium]|jgi:muramoyltetrapeptide carboxypeptidase|nr:LD-carboxypeptidase [Desulfobulbaceae bacterium]